MRRVGEVLRLTAQGLSVREVARSLGMPATTAQGYLERARRAGVGWPLPEGLDERGLEDRLFQRPELVNVRGRPEPDWREVNRELKRGKHVTLQLLWREFKEANPQGHGYTQFCRHYRSWQGQQDVVMRLSYAAGERMFVDFCGDQVPVVDSETGEVWQAEVFVAVLGASGYLYTEAVRSQDLGCWLGLHVRTFEFMEKNSPPKVDMLVMGGYGHSRLREFILGGATRAILTSMTVPTLMSH